MNLDNYITGRNDTTNPTSPYYDGKDFSKAIYCPVCKKYYLDGFEVDFEDTKGLLCDEVLCEDCFNDELANEIDNYNLED